jgi:hypothetical protein
MYRKVLKSEWCSRLVETCVKSGQAAVESYSVDSVSGSGPRASLESIEHVVVVGLTLPGVDTLTRALVVNVILAALASAGAGAVAVDDARLDAGELTETVRPHRALVAPPTLAAPREVELVVVVTWYAVLRVAVDSFGRRPSLLLRTPYPLLTPLARPLLILPSPQRHPKPHPLMLLAVLTLFIARSSES